MNWSDQWLAACAIVLVLEALLPFLAPATWRSVFLKVAQLRDGQIRFFALCALVLGLLLLSWV